MKKLSDFITILWQKLGYIRVEHILFWEEYQSRTGGTTMTLKVRIEKEIEWVRKNTPNRVIEAYNLAFKRKIVSKRDIYTFKVRWTWRLIE